ncbi:HNH endonuclease family protein [Ralstonia holmesii]|uniref:HNH endonuclease family protein n=1 Tax=Ralstonia holmesii TaxID=3058602 RepID=UPI003D64A247
MASKQKESVNLDALIPRDDVEAKQPKPSKGVIQVTELALGKHFYGLLRKPLFQRETNDWGVDNVVSLIRSFRNGHLIPAVILWSADGSTFVIDGAHRLSVFVAWVNDDYGDGAISQAFFKHQIPKTQIAAARKCRQQIKALGLEYAELQKLTLLPSRTPEQLSWSTNIAQPIETQWVVGDADVALQSFLDINQRSVEIDPTERYMIVERKAPTIVAARALVSAGRGHAYWGAFDPKYVKEIEGYAKNIYDAIFEPENAQPHTHTELQPAGMAQTANGLRLALELVNIVTGGKSGAGNMAADLDGSQTSRVLAKVWGIVKYVAGDEPASLSLHPAVYFWGTTGNHRPSMFLAVVAFVQELIQKNELVTFTLHRAKLEEFLIGKNAPGQQILGRYGGWKRSLDPIQKLLREILDGLKQSKPETEILNAISSLGAVTSNSEPVRSSAWKETRSAARIKASLESAPRCAICKARLVLLHASDDHIQRRIDGGHSGEDNAQLTHHYCNHGFKEHYAQLRQPIPEIVLPTKN